MKTLKIGIIGPTNIKKLSKLAKKPAKFFLSQATKIGKALAQVGCELWVNSDKGMANTVALAYINKKILVYINKTRELMPLLEKFSKGLNNPLFV